MQISELVPFGAICINTLLVTTSLAFADWGEVFGNALSVGPLLDRLTHRCHIVQFSGDSYRYRQSLERQQELAQVSRDTISDLSEKSSDLVKEQA